MKRIRTMMRTDVLLQARYKFFHAALFVAAVWIVLLLPLREPWLEWVLPFVLYVDVAIIGFYLLAGMVLYEKSEMTLRAMVVSPLRSEEYLGSKVATFALLSVIVSVVVALPLYPVTSIRWGLLLAGSFFTAVFALLISFIAVARYETISAFIVPSQYYLLPMALPLLGFFGVTEHPVLYLLPTYGGMLLIRGAFDTVAAWEIGYALVYMGLWIGLAGWWAKRTFNRHMRKG